jgi:hypothetical protein
MRDFHPGLDAGGLCDHMLARPTGYASLAADLLL